MPRFSIHLSKEALQVATGKQLDRAACLLRHDAHQIELTIDTFDPNNLLFLLREDKDEGIALNGLIEPDGRTHT